MSVISSPMTQSAMSEFSDFVRAHTGLHFPQSSWRDLERGMAAAASELGFAGAEACIQWMLTPPVTAQHIDALARHLTIGETYFFREQPALDALERLILPGLIEARRNSSRRLRIWSAACCTGEEPYTLAIILSRVLPDWKSWDIAILGTDINPHFLKIAAAGAYRSWSFRATPRPIRERYFAPSGDSYLVDPQIKQMVTFAQLNLAGASYSQVSPLAEDVDVIFCRNALMYFSPEMVKHTVASFHRALTPGGWLVVNPSEATPSLFPQFELVREPNVMLFTKRPLSYVHEGALVEPHPRPGYPRTLQTLSNALDAPARSSSSSTKSSTGTGAAGTPVERRTKARPPASLETRMSRQQGRPGTKEKTVAGVEPSKQDAGAFASRASVEAGTGSLSAALEWSERATRADSMNPMHWYLQATILQEQGSLSRAVSALNRVLYLDPGFVLAHFVLGNLHLQLARKSEAMRHFGIARSQLLTRGADDVLAGSEDLTVSQLDALLTGMLGEK